MSHVNGSLPIGVPKVKFSVRAHLLPPLIGIVASLAVYGLLNYPLVVTKANYYLNQFSRPSQTAAVAPGVIIDKNSTQVKIPSIGVQAPVIYDSSIKENDIIYNLRSGVVHYSTTALPGEKGNVVIFGHSSGVAWAKGDYKYVFALLEKLRTGQQISLDYQGTRYIYVVTGSKVVAPTEVDVLNNTSSSQLSLITCTPVGTSKNRLVVQAKQIVPKPPATD